MPRGDSRQADPEPEWHLVSEVHTFEPQHTFNRIRGTQRIAAMSFFLLLVGLFVSPASAAAQAVSLSPTSLSLGDQLVNTRSPAQSVTLTNTGIRKLVVSSVQASPEFAATTNCSTVTPGAVCTIKVMFTPAAAGLRTGSLTITDTAAGSPHNVPLSGTGTYIKVNPALLNFSGLRVVGTPGPVLTTKLTNTGATTVTNITVGADGDFGVSSTNCGSLTPGASCTIAASFSPSNSGTRTGSLSISDSDPGSPQSVSLSGNATYVALAPGKLNFGSQPLLSTSPSHLITVTNTGPAPLNILTIKASGDFAQNNTCGTYVGGGRSCLISVNFTPSNAGVRNGFITFSDTDGSNIQTVTMIGTGQLTSSTVSIVPRSASLTIDQTQQYNANTSVTWSVDGTPGGSLDTGTISASGLYTPPTTAGSHVINATSTVDTTQTAVASVVVTDYAGTFTYHNDNARTGQNLNETVLTTGNVNSAQFGQLFSYLVDGNIYAQPLYVPGLLIQGTQHNTVFVATQHDSVYAFDADGLSTGPLWQVSFIDASSGITTVPALDVYNDTIRPEIGITSTPVIDPTSGTLYVVPWTKEGNSYVYRLHALDLTTGAEKFGGPVLVQASVPGVGQGSDGQGNVAFQAVRQNQRPALLLSQGVVYVAFASGGGDLPPFHGWVLGYDAQTLAQVAVFNSTPNGGDGGIWQSGGGPAADADGNIFAITGNGKFDASSGGADFGNSFLKLSPGLGVADYFTPFNHVTLTSMNLDLGAGGPMLIPDQPPPYPHLIVGGGKEGRLYMLDRDNMGQSNATGDSQVVQSLVGVVSHIWCTPAFWEGNMYIAGAGDVLKAFRLYNGQLSTLPVSKGTPGIASPGASPTISANGSDNGIVWVLQRLSSTPNAILRAYDAADVSRQLYNSSQVLTRDQLHPGIKFAVPTVANGKVYVGTTSSLVVFGLLP